MSADMKDKLGKPFSICVSALFAVMLSTIPVLGYCTWFSSITEILGAKDKNMKELVLTREVIFKDESGLLPEPQVISRTGDGGFIIAGSLGRAWAIKTEAGGKTLWRNLQDKLLTGGRYATSFTGAVAMPDGSTYLCGNMSALPGSYTPSFLTHIDAAGQLLEEQYFVPQMRSERGLSYFDGCVRWGDGVAIVGHVFHVGGHVDGLEPNIDQCYWLLMLDSTGKVKWEKQIPTTFGISRVKSLLVAPDSSLMFVGDERVDKTELFRISLTGELAEKVSMDGYFTLVRPVDPDNVLQLYGFDSIDKVYSLITLNNRLEEVRRARGDHKSDFSSGFVYRMPDQSLVLFGRSDHSKYRAAIAHANSDLQFLQQIELLHDAQIYDNGSIDAVVPTGNAGEFVTVKKLLRHQTNEGRIGMARDGVAIDFIQLTNQRGQHQHRN